MRYRVVLSCLAGLLAVGALPVEASVASASVGQVEDIAPGADVDPEQYYFRAALTLESATRPELERSVFIASYIREAHRVRYVAYRVT